jgi:RNA polymerase sigma-70 factor (ECF subfamily)
MAGKKVPRSDEADAKVRALLAGGDVRGATTLAVKWLGPDLLRHLRGLLGNEADAKDAFSNACERLWKGLPGFRWESSLRTWAFQLAWSSACDLRKDRWRTRKRRLETEEQAELPARAETQSFVRVERMRISFESLRKLLTLEEQALLQLRLDEGLTWAECAQVLAVRGEAAKPETLTKRYERIKAKLARLVASGEA